ncbi:sugar transporter [Sphingobium aquiterrae]|uniref:sugar transporter n=1 Tax=Sphingobium aquiterrae TaxID=2038656 RepID=UPI00301A6C64
MVTPPRSFYAIGIAAFLWNMMGDVAYLMQVTMDLGALAKTDPYTARTFASMPAWAWSAYAIAVWGATLATVLMLLRRAIAVPLYALSLLAIIVQFSYSFLGTDLLAMKGWAAALFPALILVLGIAQFLYARAMVVKGVLR